MSVKDSDFVRVPVSEITTPKAGRICYGPSWWQVTENDEVLFYKRIWHSPQCNVNKSIVERLKRPFVKEIRFIEMAFLPHNCGDYV